ncbi:MAG: DUF362 domain-containing protein [Nitrospirae bacterium]|nr:DUF362 domain-containing protein [Nitrospirota bacterium]
MKSDVYYSRLEKGKNRESCLNTLLNRIKDFLSEFKSRGVGTFVGIKMTIGDKANTGYIKPELVRIIVDNLKKRGAKPFVFDTNVIYTGQRQNAVDHLNLAYRKGFTPDNIGCPYIIADGVFGTDSRIIKVDYKNIKEIRVPSLVSVLEDLIVLSHITGHLFSGFAGSIKNVAMGMASRAGKQVQHSSVMPAINTANCTMCGCCIMICPASAISEKNEKAFIDSKLCIGCGECISACKFDTVNINWRENTNVFAERMAEYACGILSQIKRKVFINFAFDITEECDCISGDDPKIVEDAGIFASKDILALDKACFDMLTGKGDAFSRNGKIKTHLHQFEYARKIGVGKLDYKLVEV